MYRYVRVVESLETGLALRNSNVALGCAQSGHLRKVAIVKTGLSFSPSPTSTAAGTAELDSLLNNSPLPWLVRR